MSLAVATHAADERRPFPCVDKDSRSPLECDALDSDYLWGGQMSQRVRILGLCSAVLALGVATATSVDAAATSTGTPNVAKPADYSIASATFDLPPDTQTPGSVICPVKKGVQTVPLSGGGLIDTSALTANINSSFPTKTGWHITANNGSPNDSAFTVYAVCAKKPLGYA